MGIRSVKFKSVRKVCFYSVFFAESVKILYSVSVEESVTEICFLINSCFRQEEVIS